MIKLYDQWRRQLFSAYTESKLKMEKLQGFKAIRDVILIAYDKGDISDEEFLALYNFYQAKNPEFSYAIYGRFSLHDVDVAESLANFRVRKIFLY